MSSFSAVRLNSKTFPILPFEKERLRDAGIQELIQIEGETPEDILAASKDADAILIISAKVRTSVIEELKKCKILCRYGIGTDNIDVHTATKKGIIVTNVPDFCLSEMADHTMALLLGVARKLLIMHRKMLEGDWINARLYEKLSRLEGKTVGLIGFGNTAKEVAKRAQAFGMRVIDYHRNVDPEEEKRYGVEPVSFERLLRESDFVVLLCSLTPETEGMIGEKELRIMKDSAILINTGRGALTDEAALARALKERWIAGAGIDCYSHLNVFKPSEGTPNSPYFELDNVIMTPHIGGTSEEAFFDNVTKATAELKRVLHGQWPNNLVNRNVQPWFDMSSPRTI